MRSSINGSSSLSSKNTIEDIINNYNNSIHTKQTKQQPSILYSPQNNYLPISKMRATSTILFIAGLVGTAFAADTFQYSDENW